MIDDSIFDIPAPPRTHETPEALKQRYENRPKPPASLRSGNPKDIGHHAVERMRLGRRSVDNFSEYLADLQDDQKSLFSENKAYKKKSLRQQMDMLDAMFTYLLINADYKRETPQSYNAALRAQKQFCDTMKTMASLKKSITPQKSDK